MSEGVLPIAPFPPLHWWRLAESGAVVDGAERFVKQSERTRLRLGGARGAVTMALDVVHPGDGTPMHAVLLSDHTPARVRWRTLCTDYGSAPFFEHIAPELESLFCNPPDRLLDFAVRSWEWVADWTGWKVPDVRLGGVEWDAQRAADALDLRDRATLKGAGWRFAEYPQVFAPQRGFVSRCSVLDALMHLGPDLSRQLGALAERESVR